MSEYISLPLKAGGSIAVRPRDVALIQEAGSASILLLATANTRPWELTLSALAASDLVQTTWFVGDRTHINPNHIIAIEVLATGALRYNLHGGLTATQTGVTLKQLEATLEQARADRLRQGKPV